MASATWAATGSGKPNSTELTRVIGELTRGREIADQLLSMLRDDDDASLLRTGNMVEKILDSFTGSLSIVLGTSSTYDQYSDEASRVSSYMINSPPAITKTENSGESCKKPAPKDRRGCYKRRRTSETWTKETPTPCEDGHAWRKYGQKVILNADYPRNYFRCTHKFDQLCQATKYVQKIQDEPSLHRTTYHGHHTCKKLNESALSPQYNQLLMDAAATPSDSSVIWSFQSSQLGHNNNYKSAKMMKQQKSHNHMEVLNQTKSSLTSHSHDDHHHHHVNNYFISAASPKYNNNNNNNNNQLTPRFETSSVHNNNHLSAFSSAGLDQGDVISSDGYSCTTSPVHNNIMDISSFMDFEDFPEF